MPRVIIYPRARPEPTTSAEQRQLYGARGDEEVAAAASLVADDYASRLLKYIPAEALAFVVFGTSFSSERRGQVAAVAIVAAVGQLLWLRRSAQSLPAADRPTWRYYLLSLIAYVAWVVGTSPKVRSLVGLHQTTAAIILGSVAYLLPSIDPATHSRLDPKPPEPPRVRR